MQRLSAIIPVFLLSGLLAGAARAGECHDDWSVAAPIVRKEGLVTVEKLMPMVKGKLGGDVVKVTLCEEESRFFYRVIVREGSGDLKTHTLDARNPF